MIRKIVEWNIRNKRATSFITSVACEIITLIHGFVWSQWLIAGLFQLFGLLFLIEVFGDLK